MTKTMTKEPEATKAEAKTYRPEELAKSLNVSGKQIRAFLRGTYTDHPKRTSWILSEKQAQAVRDRFTPKEEDSDEA